MQRSYQAELLDADHIPREDLFQNLKELNFINTWLGGHQISVDGLKKLIKSTPKHQYKIADVACGGGDNLIAMAKWCRENKVNCQLIGIDIKPDCIEYAKENCRYFPEISFITSDYQLVEEQFDIISCALFCHHLTEIQVEQYLSWCKNHSTIGFYINDLERNILAMLSIKWLTKLFSKSYLVKNDAPLSVKRGFLKSEWQNMLQKHSQNYNIYWKWAFRHLIICKMNVL